LAESEGLGGSKVEGDNEVWPNFTRNPKGRGEFSRLPCRASLKYARYLSLLAPCTQENSLPSLPPHKFITGSRRRARRDSMERMKMRASLRARAARISSKPQRPEGKELPKGSRRSRARARHPNQNGRPTLDRRQRFFSRNEGESDPGRSRRSCRKQDRNEDHRRVRCRNLRSKEPSTTSHLERCWTTSPQGG
jgi:hypothetical protein